MKNPSTSDQQRRHESIVSLVADAVDVAGAVRVGGTTIRIRMVRPFPGLETKLPKYSVDQSGGSLENIATAALALLYKKARFYLDNSDKLDSLADAVLPKVNDRAISAEKERWMVRFKTWGKILRKKAKEKPDDRERYERFLKSLRQQMLRRFLALDDAKQRVSEQVLEGVLSVEDVERFRRHFGRASR